MKRISAGVFVLWMFSLHGYFAQHVFDFKMPTCPNFKNCESGCVLKGHAGGFCYNTQCICYYVIIDDLFILTRKSVVPIIDHFRLVGNPYYTALQSGNAYSEVRKAVAESSQTEIPNTEEPMEEIEEIEKPKPKPRFGKNMKPFHGRQKRSTRYYPDQFSPLDYNAYTEKNYLAQPDYMLYNNYYPQTNIPYNNEQQYSPYGEGVGTMSAAVANANSYALGNGANAKSSAVATSLGSGSSSNNAIANSNAIALGVQIPSLKMTTKMGQLLGNKNVKHNAARLVSAGQLSGQQNALGNGKFTANAQFSRHGFSNGVVNAAKSSALGSTIAQGQAISNANSYAAGANNYATGVVNAAKVSALGSTIAQGQAISNANRYAAGANNYATGVVNAAKSSALGSTIAQGQAISNANSYSALAINSYAPGVDNSAVSSALKSRINHKQIGQSFHGQKSAVANSLAVGKSKASATANAIANSFG